MAKGIIWGADFESDPTKDRVPSDVTFTPTLTIYDRIVEVIRSDDDRIVEVLQDDRIVEQVT